MEQTNCPSVLICVTNGSQLQFHCYAHVFQHGASVSRKIICNSHARGYIFNYTEPVVMCN